VSRHRRLGAPTISSLSFGTPFGPGIFGPDPGAPPPLGPAGLCELLTGNARTACLIAAGVLFPEDEGAAPPGDPLVDPGGAGPCPPFFTPDPLTGECRFDIDPGPGQGLPGGNGAAGSGLTRPSAVSRRVLECPRFADGKTGILWMNALTGDVVCLPRRTSGKGFGLIRKNKPRRKAFISAAQKKSLDDMKRVQGKAKKFAEDAGFSCKKR